MNRMKLSLFVLLPLAMLLPSLPSSAQIWVPTATQALGPSLVNATTLGPLGGMTAQPPNASNTPTRIVGIATFLVT